MKKRNKWILFILILLIIGGVVSFIFLRPPKKPEYSTEKVYRGTLKQTVSLTGTAKPKKMVNLALEKSGLVNEINVKVGDEVKEGDLLLSLDSSETSLQAEQAQANFNLAKSNLKMAQTRDLEAAKTAYQKAYQAYLDTKAADNRSLREAEVALEEAKNNSRDYQEYFDEVASEYEDDNTTKMVRDLARANLTQIQGTEQKTKEALETLKVANKQAENTAWYLQDQAWQTLEKQRALAYNWEKSSLLNQVDYNRVALDLAHLNLKKMAARTPLEGIVSKIDLEEGETIVAYTPFLTLVTKELEIEAKVPEADITKIKVGQEGEITFDALSDKILTGKVVSIEPTETMIEGVTYYKIKVSFSDPENLVKSGMTADLAIKIYSKENVLIAPERAVKEQEGEKYVQVKKGEEIKEIKIKTGLRGDSGTVEIVEGLKEEDEVVTFIKEKK